MSDDDRPALQARIAALEREGALLRRKMSDWNAVYLGEVERLTLERDGARLNYDKLLAEAAERVGAAEARVDELEREGARLKAVTAPPAVIEQHARKAVLMIQEQGLPDERLTPEQLNLLTNMRFILTKFAAALALPETG